MVVYLATTVMPYIYSGSVTTLQLPCDLDAAVRPPPRVLPVAMVYFATFTVRAARDASYPQYGHRDTPPTPHLWFRTRWTRICTAVPCPLPRATATPLPRPARTTRVEHLPRTFLPHGLLLRGFGWTRYAFCGRVARHGLPYFLATRLPPVPLLIGSATTLRHLFRSGSAFPWFYLPLPGTAIPTLPVDLPPDPGRSTTPVIPCCVAAPTGSYRCLRFATMAKRLGYDFPTAALRTPCHAATDWRCRYHRASPFNLTFPTARVRLWLPVC